jgi:nitrogen fixation protein
MPGLARWTISLNNGWLLELKEIDFTANHSIGASINAR